MLRVCLPVLGDLDLQVEVDRRTQQRLDLRGARSRRPRAAGRPCGRSRCPSGCPARRRCSRTRRAAACPRAVLAQAHLLDDDRDRVRQLVADALERGLADQLRDQRLLRLVGDLTLGVERRSPRAAARRAGRRARRPGRRDAAETGTIVGPLDPGRRPAGDRHQVLGEPVRLTRSALVATRDLRRFATFASSLTRNRSPGPTVSLAGRQTADHVDLGPGGLHQVVEPLTQQGPRLVQAGVSTRTSCASGRCTMPVRRAAWSAACDDVIATFWPTSALVSVDLPALGRPTKQAKPDSKGSGVDRHRGPRPVPRRKYYRESRHRRSRARRPTSTDVRVGDHRGGLEAVTPDASAIATASCRAVRSRCRQCHRARGVRASVGVADGRALAAPGRARAARASVTSLASSAERSDQEAPKAEWSRVARWFWSCGVARRAARAVTSTVPTWLRRPAAAPPSAQALRPPPRRRGSAPCRAAWPSGRRPCRRPRRRAVTPNSSPSSSTGSRAADPHAPSDSSLDRHRGSTSYSSVISPTISSRMSSIVTSPAVPPYSSTTIARCVAGRLHLAQQLVDRLGVGHVHARRASPTRPARSTRPRVVVDPAR